MIRIDVEIYGHYADLAGRSKAAVEVPDGTVRGFVAELKRTWPRGFVEAVLDEEGKEFNLGVLVMVNSQPVYHLQGLDTKLADGDKVIFLPPMAGGGSNRLVEAPGWGVAHGSSLAEGAGRSEAK